MSLLSAAKQSIGITVRLKPLEAETRSEGIATARHVSCWDADERHVTVEGGPRARNFTFPKAIIPPTMGQDATFQRSGMPELVDAVLNGYDVNFLAFGQTGSGKTHTIFGPPGSMKGATGLKEEHGMFMRGCLLLFEGMQRREREGIAKGTLAGTMVEVHFDCLFDLLNGKQPCSIGEDHMLQGAESMLLESERDIALLGSKCEMRTTNGTLMNDTSSRSHCITTITLTQKLCATEDAVVSRLCFVDLMGSERSKGQNSAHDVTKNNKETVAGMEGITANYTLAQFSLCVQQVYEHEKQVSKTRKQGPKAKGTKGGYGFVQFRFMNLTRILHRSFTGSALTAMVLTLSQAPRNGNEVYETLNYGELVSKLCLKVHPQKPTPFASLVALAQKNKKEQEEALGALKSRQQASGYAVNKSGYASNTSYVEMRTNQVRKWTELLEALSRVG